MILLAAAVPAAAQTADTELTRNIQKQLSGLDRRGSDSPAQKLRCRHCRTLSPRRSRSTLKGVHPLAATQNLNYGLVKATSNSRQNPVLALLFLQTPGPAEEQL